jgi:hypothetical protein
VVAHSYHFGLKKGALLLEMQELYDIKVLKTIAYLHFYVVRKTMLEFKHRKGKNENKKTQEKHYSKALEGQS